MPVKKIDADRSADDQMKGHMKVHMETWGCQMNVADSEAMLALLAKENYTPSDQPEDADLIVLNTCHIREKATHKVLSRLGVLKELKDKNPGLKIAVAGCVAQAEGQKLLKAAPHIDILFGPGRIQELPDLLKAKDRKDAVALGFPKQEGIKNKYGQKGGALPMAGPSAEPVPTLTGKNEVSRYLNITQGCDNFCTFCVVPQTRGREISHRPDFLVKEAAKLVEAGAQEITLLGQNVNSYGQDLVANSLISPSEDGPFVDLLRDVAALPGLQRLRFTTSNPHDFSLPLARVFAAEPKLGRYLHLPVQSGSNVVLEKMRRKVTREEYFERVDWLRELIPDMAFSTDLIVGFPGETDEDFAQTLSLVERVQFSFIFSFKYSPRKGTAAARFVDQVPEDVKDRRLQELNALQKEITQKSMEAQVGQIQDVLFLYESQKEAGTFYGRTPHYRLVRVRASRNPIGQILPVEITGAQLTSLSGVLTAYGD